MPRLRIDVDPRTVDMSEAVLECREMMHPWKRVGQGAYGKTDRGRVTAVEVLRRCGRCRTERVDVYSTRDWSLVQRTYRYADGYLPKRDKDNPLPGLTRNQVRAALFARTMKELIR